MNQHDDLIARVLGWCTRHERKAAREKGKYMMGDTTWCKGKVVKKYKQDGYPLVDLEVWAENQRGERTVTNASATVMLPSKDIKTKMFRDGSGIDMGFACYS